ncbi:hypothetical protein, partial [Neisseria polysaccharea]|uniref:hypothetical protein n=1 Tax=Neisseria polysaccharea TaxID=489 RepID=UPI0027E14B7A
TKKKKKKKNGLFDTPMFFICFLSCDAERESVSRHSHESGNLETQSCKNLSETAETERSGFPPARE